MKWSCHCIDHKQGLYCVSSLSPLALNSPGGTFNCKKQVIKCSSDLSDPISGQLTTERLTRSWMTKWERRQYWAICTWAPTTRGRYRFSSIVLVASVWIVCAAAVSCWSDTAWKVRYRPTYWRLTHWALLDVCLCHFLQRREDVLNSSSFISMWISETVSWQQTILSNIWTKHPRCSCLSFWR